MLKRLYVDNYRCLDNFELKLDRIVLLLGENGTGKSTVFDVLRRLQRFLLGQSPVRTAFPPSHLTRWQTSLFQHLELDLQVGTDTYFYTLHVGHDEAKRKTGVMLEKLLLNNRPLFSVENGLARLEVNEDGLGTEFPFDPAQSVVGSFLPASANRNLARFKEEMEKFVVCSIKPPNIHPRSEEEVRLPSRTMEDFVSWYRYLSQEYQGAMIKLNHELRAVLPGFTSFRLKHIGGNIREMLAYFRAGEDAPELSYTFKELSDGQRVLIVLYTLLYGLDDRGAYLFIDEPENFVALREIQPWLMSLYDRAGGPVKQAVLISHHPELIDYLGPADGRWFVRNVNGAARVSEQPSLSDGSLSLSEMVARGWEK